MQDTHLFTDAHSVGSLHKRHHISPWSTMGPNITQIEAVLAKVDHDIVFLHFCDLRLLDLAGFHGGGSPGMSLCTSSFFLGSSRSNSFNRR